MTLRLSVLRLALTMCLGVGIAACGDGDKAANISNTKAEAPAASAESRWTRVGVGGCDGNDIGRSDGAEPQAEMCNQPWISAVCTDGETFGRGSRPSCVYKSTPASQCSGGTARGLLYTCEPGRAGS